MTNTRDPIRDQLTVVQERDGFLWHTLTREQVEGLLNERDSLRAANERLRAALEKIANTDLSRDPGAALCYCAEFRETAAQATGNSRS